MNKYKKLFLIVVLLFVASFSLPVSVSANAPVPVDHLTAILSNLPDNAVYADLLIKIDENDPQYVDFQPNAFVHTASGARELVAYSKDGFRSFTFHYKDAKSNIRISHYYNYDHTITHYVDFCNGLEYRDYLTQYENLRKDYRDIKLVLLDKEFNIIAVSETTQLPKESSAFRFNGSIYYDFTTNIVEYDNQINPLYVIFGGFYSILIMLISIWTEVTLARFFGLERKYRRTILIVNVCSQIIMRVLYAVMPFTYLVETCILEILVYSAEFLIYKKRFGEVRTRTLVYYTVAANTLSLLLGIFLDCYILA